MESEERGVAEAIAVNLREMMMIEVPIIVIVCGEGGSGGALGIAIGDRVMMQEFSVYSVIPPEGCAAILWRDANKKVEAATALKITAPDMVALGLVDDIIPEPPGGAHNDYETATALVDQALSASLARAVGHDGPRAPRFALRQVPADGRGRHRSPIRQRIDRQAGHEDASVWNHLPCNDEEAKALGDALNLHPTVARLLCLRGLGDPEAARRFLTRRWSISTIPSCSPTWGRRSSASSARSRSKERIAIHGDYDVDGITSTVILRRALEMLGGEVVHFIPERLRDGYGLQPAAIDRLHGEGVHLIISVDCGIRGTEAALRARELGVDLIITDHHEPDGTLPPALAVINPKRHDCTYPDKNLAGVGVALKLVQALCQRAGKTKWLPAFVKIAAIGTLADVVPLVGENRVIAKLGLAVAQQGAAHGRPARAARGVRAHRQDDRQLPGRVHPRAARQRRRTHEHARHRDAAAARHRRRWPSRKRAAWRSS